MSRWRALIEPKSPMWSGIVAYADERIEDLTAVCVATKSTDQEIRQAQAGIAEMQRLKGLPDSITATVQMSGRGNRKGY